MHSPGGGRYLYIKRLECTSSLHPFRCVKNVLMTPVKDDLSTGGQTTKKAVNTSAREQFQLNAVKTVIFRERNRNNSRIMVVKEPCPWPKAQG